MTQSESPLSPRARLDEELKAIRRDVLDIGDMVKEAIARAVQALHQHDVEAARQIIEADAAINDKRFEVEDQCLNLIATQQPAAGDLRAIVAAVHLVSDLERMGDHAVGIAKAILRGVDAPVIDVPPAFDALAEEVQSMLSMALKAYREADVDLAQRVAAMDDAVDDHYRELFRSLLDVMTEDPDRSGAGVRLQFASHNLERIADRATNIAERVIFQASGEMQELNPEPGDAQIS